MKKNRFISILLCLAMLLPVLCTRASASDINVPIAVQDYLQKGDYFSIYPNSTRYTIYSATAERTPVFNQVEKGSDVWLWNIGTGKWCVQREKDGVFAIMYVENREDHEGGDDGSSPKFWALNGDNTEKGTLIHMWEDKNVNDKEKTFYLEENNDGDPETFYLCSAYAYEKGGARYVAPADNNWRQQTTLVLSNIGYSWRINVHSRDTGYNANINWMSQLDGKTLLSNINIPGTHDSCTANINASYAENANNYTCQQHFIDEQLINGVRAFDIRYCYNKGDEDVFTCHGGGNLRCATPEYDDSKPMTVDWVMGKMTAFLNPDENNKTRNETIIMVVKQDDNNDDAPKHMAETLLDYEKYLYDWSKPSPTLADVRGKIVIMSRTDFSGVVKADKLKYFGPDISNWDNKYDDDKHWAQKIGKDDDSVQVYIQDDFESPDDNKQTQVVNVIKQLSGQKSSMSRVDVNDVPDIPDTAFCFNYTSMTASIDPNPLGAARVMNSWMTRGDGSPYFKNGSYRTGIVMTDYCDQVLCDLIIASNYGRMSHSCTYMDVSENDWFHDFVEKAAELNLMTGTGGRQFSPEIAMGSAMVVQVLYNHEGRPEVQIEDGFDPDVWYAPAVSWGLQQGIIDDGFSPDEAMPRQDMILMMYNYAKLKGLDTSAADDLAGFVDAEQVSPDAKDAVSWAVGSGIISGDDLDQLLPENGIKRSEAAKIFVNFAGFAV